MLPNQDTFKSKNAYVARTEKIDQKIHAFMEEQVDYILSHRATDHPFLNQYARTGLPAEQSRVLYLETLHYFKYLPFYVCGISTITRDENVLRSITFNACDELGETESHSDLYLDFLRKKGITQKDIESYQCLPSTQSLNDGIRFLYSTPPLQKAMGALFADETMSASMVAKYNAGLIKEGLDAKERSFWTLHMEVEVGHSNAVFNIMERHLQSDDERAMFKEGVRQYLHLMEAYWDGIAGKLSAGER